MTSTKIPENEKARLNALRSYQILDIKVEPEFDNLTQLASEICDSPLALITIVDESRQWFKSHLGVREREQGREMSICAHAILTPDKILLVEDTRKDERFKDNPNVTNPVAPFIFYAGVPILTKEGFPLGTLCIIDHKPKRLKKFQIRALKTLAKQVEQLFELRKAKIGIEENHIQLSRQFRKLKTYQKAVEEAVIFAITNREGKIIHANKRFRDISGFSENEILGSGFELIDSSHYENGFWKTIYDSLQKGNVWKGRIKYRNKSGDSYWVKSTIVPLQSNDEETPSEYSHIQKDITEIVTNEQLRVNEVIYQHEKNYAGISHNLREGIAQSIAGLRFHLIAMESQLKSGKSIQADSVMALQDILKELMEETNDLAFDIMPRSLIKEGIRDALHSFFNRLESEYDAEINFDDEDLKCFPIVKSAEIQIYRGIVNLYLKALERSNSLRSTFQLLSEPKVGLQLIIEQGDIKNEDIAESIVPTINKIGKQVRLVDGKFSVNYTNNKKTFEIQLTLPKEYTQKATSIEEEVIAQ